MTFRRLTVLALAVAGVAAGSPARAEVAVIANRSRAKMNFTLRPAEGEPTKFSLQSGDLLPVAWADGIGASLQFNTGKQIENFALEPASAYFFHGESLEKGIGLEQIGLVGEPPAPPNELGRPRAMSGVPATPPPTTVTVKILVDDEEAGVRRLWEERLRKRIARASSILEQYARIKLEVIAVDTWETNDATSGDASQDFTNALREFETKVIPAPAQIAIGFSSQYTLLKGQRTHVGGTRGPFNPHILIREWSKHHSEPERLELLVHELGHHFGAAHSPEPQSVMRPVLGDRKSVARDFRIAFDPLNTLAMNIIGRELRGSKVNGFRTLSPLARRRLSGIYATIARAFPSDPAAAEYLRILGDVPPPVVRTKRQQGTPLAEASRRVALAVVESAAENRRLATADPKKVLQGDALTERYVRAGAAAALEVPLELRGKALCLGLGVALGDTDSLLTNPITAPLLASVEGPDERARRLAVIGAPTMRGRNDLVRHYFISAALAAIANPDFSRSAGILKELRDSQTSSGFSSSDLCADLAGIALAGHVKDSETNVAELADAFTIDRYLPQLEGLKDGLTDAQFRDEYGSASDVRFTGLLDQLQERVRQLPAYRTIAATTKGG